MHNFRRLLGSRKVAVSCITLDLGKLLWNNDEAETCYLDPNRLSLKYIDKASIAEKSRFSRIKASMFELASKERKK